MLRFFVGKACDLRNQAVSNELRNRQVENLLHGGPMCDQGSLTKITEAQHDSIYLHSRRTHPGGSKRVGTVQHFESPLWCRFVLSRLTDASAFSRMPAAMSLTDGQIMERVLAGQDELFEQLVQRHRTTMLRAATSKLRNPSLAEEAVQDAFLCAYARRATFNPAYSFRGWLWTILLHVSRTIARREFTRIDRADGGRTSFFECEPVDDDNTLKRLVDSERSEMLGQLLDSLSEAQADALRLRFFGGLKFEEVAQAMGCSLNGAKLRVRRGL